MDHPTVRVTAIGCIIDILVVFGVHPFLEIADKFEEVSLDLSRFFSNKNNTYQKDIDVKRAILFHFFIN